MSKTTCNRSVESVRHAGHDDEPLPNDSSEEQYEAIAKAVNSQLNKSKVAIIQEVSDHADHQIAAAIKRALDSHDAQQQSQKKSKKVPEFKREGNKIRYKINEDILEKVEDAIKAIDQNDLDDAKEALEGGKKIITKQQKLICLADREDNGWEVVKHYLSDDLASDSEDEKAINKARRDALASIKKRQTQKKGKFRNAPQQRRSYDSSFKRELEPKFRFDNRRDYQKKSILCYRCGDSGHMQYACPLKFERR